MDWERWREFKMGGFLGSLGFSARLRGFNAGVSASSGFAERLECRSVTRGDAASGGCAWREFAWADYREAFKRGSGRVRRRAVL